MPPAAYDSNGPGYDTPVAMQGVGRPGERQLEGARAPSLTIEKRAPSEIQVGKVATFTTTVRNQGQVAAQGVEVRDLVPQGTELVGTSPQAEQGPQGELVWQLGTLKPGSETTVEMQLMPLAEGEIGSVATLHFEAGASVRTKATRPQVAIDVTAPPRVMVGTEITLRIKISNPGSGAATGVVVTEVVPANLTHPGGSELELEIGTLKPGESRELELGLKAVRPGPVTNVLDRPWRRQSASRRPGSIRSRGARFEGRHVGAEASLSGADGGLHHFGFQSRNGARQGYRSFGAAAQGIEIRRGEQRRSVRPGDRVGLLEFGAIAPGRDRHGDPFDACRPSRASCICRSAQRARGNLSDKVDETVFVEGIAAIMFEVVDVNDPIEVGGETTYEIRVMNQGSKASGNVRLVVLLPAELQAIDADGPTGHAIDGQRGAVRANQATRPQGRHHV